jgi:hypothetical protein
MIVPRLRLQVIAVAGSSRVTLPEFEFELNNRNAHPAS